MRVLTLLFILLTFPALAQDGIPGSSGGSSEDLLNLHEGYQTEIPHMATPSCVTYPEWTGMNAKDINKSVLEGRAYRILGPDSMATMDYSPNRLNIHTDDKGIIIEQVCG